MDTVTYEPTNSNFTWSDYMAMVLTALGVGTSLMAISYWNSGSDTSMVPFFTVCGVILPGVWLISVLIMSNRKNSVGLTLTWLFGGGLYFVLAVLTFLGLFGSTSNSLFGAFGGLCVMGFGPVYLIGLILSFMDVGRYTAEKQAFIAHQNHMQGFPTQPPAPPTV